jgi:hypothetical protein
MQENKYTKWYLSLINSRRELIRSKQDSYFEQHHIIPVSCGGSNRLSNLILLTAREHFLAHWILVYATKSPQLIQAFHRMCHSGSKYKVTSRTYETMKKYYGQIVSHRTLDTVTALDNTTNKYVRITRDQFLTNRNRYVGVNTGVKRSKDAVDKERETKFPYIVKIKSFIFTDGASIRNHFPFARRNFLDNLYLKQFNPQVFLAVTKSKFKSILHDEIKTVDQFRIHIYDKIKIYLKPEYSQSDIISSMTRQPLQASAGRNSAIARSGGTYIVNGKTYLRAKDVMDSYYGITENHLYRIRKNSNISLVQANKIADIIGSKTKAPKTWGDIGICYIRK